MDEELIPAPTIGEILREDYLEPLGLSAYALAKYIHVPVSRIQEILSGKRRVTADTSLRLSRFFGVSDGFFLRIQADLDIRAAKILNAKDLDAIEKLERKIV